MEEIIRKGVFEIFPESVTDPFVVSVGARLGFCFLAMGESADGRLEDAGLATVKTANCLIYKSGYPNDEATRLHPLFEAGFDGTEIVIVENSKWIGELENQNRKGWPQTDYSDFKHWIFPFKETTLELIARDLELTVSAEKYETCKAELLAWVEEY